jgi:transcriptional regulator with XRE-family HTH domain
MSTTVPQMDKRDRARLFRERLTRAMEDRKIAQSALARAVGADRSTLSQLLASDGKRLPNAQLVAGCAAALGVTADWLLGLSDRPERAGDLVDAALAMPQAPRALVDETIFSWHRAAQGYKIRHVPAGLPDMLKTPAMLRWEAEPSLGRTVDQAIGASQDRLTWMQSGQSDYEIAVPLHEAASFVRAEGLYTGLPRDIRRAQVAHLIALTRDLYPGLRLVLFDARRLYSAPITIFGPLMAVVYLGANYLVFRDTARVQAITRHFDGLVREADVSARDVGAHLWRLAAEAGL